MESPTPNHLQIFRPHKQIENDRTFHLFTRLIPELRLAIWRFAFQRHRIVRVCLQTDDIEKVDGEPVWKWSTYHSTPPDEPYGVVVAGHRLMNKFLRVCRESRAEVLSFYRVHIPCRFTTKSFPVNDYSKASQGTLYFNPEHDVLHLSSRFAPPTNSAMFFIDFIARLKLFYDPKHIGLLHLAFEQNDVAPLHTKPKYRLETRSPVPPAFSETIQQLQNIYFMTIQRFGRINPGLISGADTQDFYMTRSFPIMLPTPNFELLGPDPRPIEEDLRRMNMDDLREPFFCSWQALLRNLGVQPSNETVYSYLAAFSSSLVEDEATAKKYLQNEDKHWRDPTKLKGGIPEPEDLDNVARPALGLWLFPASAFGGIAPDGTPIWNGETNGRAPKDLRKFHPILALSTME